MTGLIHGTRTAYTRRACRCDACTANETAYRRRYRHREGGTMRQATLYPDGNPVDVLVGIRAVQPKIAITPKGRAWLDANPKEGAND